MRRHRATARTRRAATTVVVAAIAALGAACVPDLSGRDAADVQQLGVLSAARPLGAFDTPAISESSALGLDTGDGTVRYWTLNDSGHEPELFVVDSAGRLLSRVKVDGPKNRDWEALAVGPCPSGTCVYVGDVGDNAAQRKHVDVWRVPIPSPLPSRATVKPSGHVRIDWPGGARDVEAMWLGADTTLWFATKRPMRRPDGTIRPSLVHRLDVAAWRQGTAEPPVVDSLPIVPAALPWQVVDASWGLVQGTPRLAIVTYATVQVFATDSTGRPGARLAVCALTPLGPRQGEGVAWRPSGALLFSAEGKGAPLWEGRCP